MFITLFIIVFAILSTVFSLKLTTKTHNKVPSNNRIMESNITPNVFRKCISRILLSSLLSASPFTPLLSYNIQPSHAAINTPSQSASQQTEYDPNDINRLKKGLNQLNFLLEHWNEKTLYCNFGEFQRELLSPENKDKLMASAKETSLWDYDKSKTMNVMW